ncbi:MAG: hypothetical protein WC799_23880 [Desulfobacteraceae bacterium]
MKIILLLLIFFQSSDRCQLPERLDLYLKRNAENWELINPNDLVTDWSNFMSKQKCPSLVTADFNGDGHIDYCGLFKKNAKYKLMIIEGDGKSFSIKYNEDIEYGIYDGGLGVGIELENSGNVQGLRKQVYIRNAHIGVLKFESSKHIIYFDKGKYNELYVSD